MAVNEARLTAVAGSSGHGSNGRDPAARSRLLTARGALRAASPTGACAFGNCCVKAEDCKCFERLLVNFWTGLADALPEKFDEAIEAHLKALTESFGNDRLTLVTFSAGADRALIAHSYAVPGCEPASLGVVPTAVFPWYFGETCAGRPVFLRSLSADWPAEAYRERRYCIAQGIKSYISVPLRAGSLSLGSLDFAFLRGPCRWPAEVIARLQVIGEMFAFAIQRQQAKLAFSGTLTNSEPFSGRREQDHRYLRGPVVPTRQYGRIVGQSEALTRVLAEVEQVAATDVPVLLIGETGTGKELLAETIHDLSARRSRPMVIVNCASLPAPLIESELFGREAGAYTGASSAQPGRFAMANDSTLFLDEISEFPVELQAKLLRVLQDGRFERLGSPKTVAVDVRIIAATNQNLEQAVRAGDFRADLYHRLNVFPIHLPPLRDRREDIPLLVWHFVEAVGRRMGKTVKRISRKTIEQLQRYSWPGNVRELRNVVERAMIHANGDTLRVEIPAGVTGPAPYRMTLKDREREQILQILQQTTWRIRGPGGAAEILGIKPTTLESRMAKLGIKRATRG